MKTLNLVLAVAATFSFSAHAATSLNLGSYTVTGTYGLDRLNGTSGGISGLEGSAITYAKDRNSLFYVGDEGTGVIEISKTGATLGFSQFNWAGTGSVNNDAEGLAYVGNGQLVVIEERLQDAYKFTYQAGTTVQLNNSFVSISNATVGNNGIEGISYDSRDGSFVTVKQQSPQNVFAGGLTFAAATGPAGSGVTPPPGGGVSTMVSLFNPATLGLTSLSDVSTLSGVNSLVGTSGANNLLFLSLGSKKIVEADRLGNVLGSFDLSNVVPNNAIEGITIDENGVIYLIAEQFQPSPASLATGFEQSQLIVLSPVPEASTYAMMLAGLGMVGFLARRKNKSHK
jgi:uncharacterized protein YjiK